LCRLDLQFSAPVSAESHVLIFIKSPPEAEFHTSIFCVAHVLWAYHGPLDLDPIHQMVRG